jgi:hypothetical protein
MIPIHKRMRVVLIVDEDLGFICWLGERLSRAGYQTLPALGTHQAALLLKQLEVAIDILIMDQQFLDVFDVIGTLSSGPRPVKIVPGRNPSPHLLRATHADAVLERPSSADSFGRLAWFRMLIRALREAEAAAKLGHEQALGIA